MVRYEEILERDDVLPNFSKIQNTLVQLEWVVIRTYFT
jgi:hypothetical protein